MPTFTSYRVVKSPTTVIIYDAYSPQDCLLKTPKHLYALAVVTAEHTF